jgi:uncharacterized protein YcbK (DUF882 family)
MTGADAQTKVVKTLGRRQLICGGIAAAVAATVMEPAESLAFARPPARQLSLLNLHTGERVRAEYWAKGRYQNGALRELNRVLRDPRNGQIHAMDPQVIDLAHALSARFGGNQPVQVICGYRSPETNAALRDEDPYGVAQFSYHLVGKAIDLRIPGVPLASLYRAALALRGGGVGYYPESNFVHVDVGPVRQWVG